MCFVPSYGSSLKGTGRLVALIASGIADVRLGIRTWPVWWLLAKNDLARRYKRSMLGQFWMTLSMGALILGLGIVYSTLFKTDISAYLPYVGVGFVSWA